MPFDQHDVEEAAEADEPGGDEQMVVEDSEEDSEPEETMLKPEAPPVRKCFHEGGQCLSMSAEEGQVSDGQINSEPEGGLESGEESDHESSRPRQNVHDQVRQGSNNRYRPRPAHVAERGGHRRSNWRGYGRGDPGRRHQGRSGERHDRNGHVPRPRHQHRPAPPRRDNVKHVPATTGAAKSRSPSRERQPSRENSCSLEQNASKPDVAASRVHQTELAKMQELITLDTVGVAAAKQSFKHMCSVLAQGLDIQHQVWSAERDRGQAASLYRDPDWEGMRSRLLSGLKAIHLVCTAGLVDEDQSIRLGLSTLQKACTMSAALTNLRRPQQMPEVQAWCSSLNALLNGTHAQPSTSKPNSPADHATTAVAARQDGSPVASSPAAHARAGANTAAAAHTLSEQEEAGDGSAAMYGSPSSSSAEEPADADQDKMMSENALSAAKLGDEAQAAPVTEGGVPEVSSPAEPNRPGLLNLGHTAEQTTDAGFKPRVMFRLNVGGASALTAPELVRRQTPSASPTPRHPASRTDTHSALEEPSLAADAAAAAIETDRSAGTAADIEGNRQDARAVSPGAAAPSLQCSDAATDVPLSPAQDVEQDDAPHQPEISGAGTDRDEPQPMEVSAAEPSPQLHDTVREQEAPIAEEPPAFKGQLDQSTQHKDSDVRFEPTGAQQAHEQAPQGADSTALPAAPPRPSSAETPKGEEGQRAAEEVTTKPPKRRSRWDMRGAVASPPTAEPSSAPQPPPQNCSPAKEQRRMAAPPQEPRSNTAVQRDPSPERSRWNSERSPRGKGGHEGAQKRARTNCEDDLSHWDKARFRREGSRPARSPGESANKRVSRERSDDRRTEVGARKRVRSPRTNGVARASPGVAATPSRPPPLPPLPPIAVSAPKPGGGVCVEEEPVTPPSADEGAQGAHQLAFADSAVQPSPVKTSSPTVARRRTHAGPAGGPNSADKERIEGRRRAAAPAEAPGSAVRGAGVRHMSPVSPPASSLTPEAPLPSSVRTKQPRTVDQLGARAAAPTAATDNGEMRIARLKVETKAADWISSLPGSLSPVTPPDSPSGAPSSSPAKPDSVGGPRHAASGAVQGTHAVADHPTAPPKEDSLQSNGLSSSARLSPHCVDSMPDCAQAPHSEHAAPPQPPDPPIESDPSNEDIMLPHPSTDPVRALVADGRLLLLVNLEGTLIDVAKPSSVEKWPPEQQHQLQLTVSAQSPVDTSLLQLPGSLLWIKMRPGWQQCMYRLACFYALRLVSDLKPEVVAQIRHLMDPHEQLFDSTVQSSSRVDAKKKPVRQLQHAPGFPALSPIALVLDNKQSQLWHAPDMPHVMHCERYCFFPRPSMGTAAPCLLAAGRDEAAQDSVLLYATEALLRTHGRFYQKLLTSSSGSEAYRTTSVCNVMAEELSTVLQGCTLLLASCTSSLKEKQVDHLLDLGRQFGAKWMKCGTSDQEADQVTHVIAVSPESSEVLWGAETQRSVVKPAWLLCCGITWTRVQEDEFSIL